MIVADIVELACRRESTFHTVKNPFHLLVPSTLNNWISVCQEIISSISHNAFDPIETRLQKITTKKLSAVFRGFFYGLWHMYLPTHPHQKKMSTKSDAAASETSETSDAAASETSETSDTQKEQDRKSVIWQCIALIMEEHNDTYKK